MTRPRKYTYKIAHRILCAFCVFMILFAAAAHAQYNETQLLSNIKGLKSNEVSNIFVDSKNGVWISNFATTGINLYDGQKVRFVKTLQGKHSAGHNNAIEDKYGNIWVLREGVGITQYNNGKITDFEIKKDGMPEVSGATIDWKTNKLLVYNATGEVYNFDYTTKKFVLKFKVPYINKDYELYKVMANIDGVFFFQARNAAAGVSDMILYDKNKEFALLPRITQKNDIRPARIVANKYLVCATDGKFFVLTDNYKNWKEIRTPATTNQSWNLLGGRQNQLFIAHQPTANTHELYELSATADKWLKKAIFKNKFMLFALTTDEEGNYWFSSSGGALKVYKNLVNYNLDDHSSVADIANICQSSDGKIWVASSSQGLSYIDNNTQKFVLTLPDFMGATGGIPLQNNQILLPYDRNDSYKTGGTMLSDGKKTTQTFITTEVNRWQYINNKLVCATPKDGVWISKQPRVFINNPEAWLHINKDNTAGMALDGSADAAYDANGNLWIGRVMQGVAVYMPKQNTAKTWLRTNETDHFGAASLTADPQKNIWIGTDKGLYFYDIKDFDVKKTDIFKDAIAIAPQILRDYKVNSLQIYKNKYLIAGTTGGLALIDIEAFYKNMKAQPPIVFYNKNNGFAAEMCINHGVIPDAKQPNIIWIAHEQGLTRLTLNIKNLRKYPPCLRIDSIQTGTDNNTKIKSNYIYINNPRISSLKIYFSDSIMRYNNGETAYQYRIIHKNQPAKYNDFFYNTEIDLPYITPGKYILEIIAIQNGVPAKPYLATIEITDFWFKQLWFVLMALTLIGFIVFRTLQRNNQLKLQTLRNDQLQSQSIATQLNPHFLNNALQLLQSRITNDPEAVRFVGKLSENVQMVFVNTRKKLIYHRLADEMVLLENYLSMQKFRFGKRLEYTLPPKTAIERLGSYQILLMQLQIHCENAIEHGIRNQEQGGELTIIFIECKDYICIEIQDTGIGRKKAAAIGSKSTQQGTLMLQQLHDIYNTSQKNKNNLKIQSYYTDDIFHTPNYESFGTKITIKIPKIYTYELD